MKSGKLHYLVPTVYCNYLKFWTNRCARHNNFPNKFFIRIKSTTRKIRIPKCTQYVGCGVKQMLDKRSDCDPSSSWWPLPGHHDIKVDAFCSPLILCTQLTLLHHPVRLLVPESAAPALVGEPVAGRVVLGGSPPGQAQQGAPGLRGGISGQGNFRGRGKEIIHGILGHLVGSHRCSSACG